VEGESLVRLAQAGSAPLEEIVFLENPKLKSLCKAAFLEKCHPQ
jgi:hypothetical protein